MSSLKATCTVATAMTDSSLNRFGMACNIDVSGNSDVSGNNTLVPRVTMDCALAQGYTSDQIMIVCSNPQQLSASTPVPVPVSDASGSLVLDTSGALVDASGSVMDASGATGYAAYMQSTNNSYAYM